MTDYIRLPRSALELASDDTLWRVCGYLLSKADDKGVATFKASELGLRFNLSRQRLRTVLCKLVKNGVATNYQPTSNQQATNITFDFQLITPTEQPTTNQLPTNYQPTKRVRKPNKFTPPTDAEVAAYVTEKGYHFNPELFVPFYQSKGWMVGKNPMKDWKASCRTWELEWKKKHGERFYYEIQPAVPADTAVTRAQSRDRLRSLATGVVSRSADKLLNLYNGVGQNPDDSAD